MRDRRRARRGSATLIVLVALVALLAASALALDAGLLWTARTQLQGTVDASALAAAGELIDPLVPEVTSDEAYAAASAVSRANSAVPVSSVELAEVEIGHWDPAVRRFEPAIDLSDPERVDAVTVNARLDGAANRAVPAVMSRVLGNDAFTVSATATAWLGFAGSAPPGELTLPIAVDCCALQGPGCAAEFCDWLANEPPNPCPILPALVQGSGFPQYHDDPVTHPLSCLDLAGTTVQNACWTNFEPPGSSINTSDLRRLIDTGNAVTVLAHQHIELDNGDKTDALRNIQRRFDDEGSDRYAPHDGANDSWVVRLPVVSCQQNTQPCNQGEITGFVCFEVRQVEVVPAKMLRGRFLCRERDPELFAECGLDGSEAGGEDFGIRAEIPVLVR